MQALAHMWRCERSQTRVQIIRKFNCLLNGKFQQRGSKLATNKHHLNPRGKVNKVINETSKVDARPWWRLPRWRQRAVKLENCLGRKVEIREGNSRTENVFWLTTLAAIWPHRLWFANFFTFGTFTDSEVSKKSSRSSRKPQTDWCLTFVFTSMHFPADQSSRGGRAVGVIG